MARREGVVAFVGAKWERIAVEANGAAAALVEHAVVLLLALTAAHAW